MGWGRDIGIVEQLLARLSLSRWRRMLSGLTHGGPQNRKGSKRFINRMSKGRQSVEWLRMCTTLSFQAMIPCSASQSAVIGRVQTLVGRSQWRPKDRGQPHSAYVNASLHTRSMTGPNPMNTRCLSNLFDPESNH